MGETKEKTPKQIAKEKRQLRNTIIFVLIVVVIAIFFLNRKLRKKEIEDLKDELQKSTLDANKKHKILSQLIEKQVKKKKQLDRKFWWIYFSIRIAIVGLWGAILGGYYFINKTLTLTDILDVSQVILIILLLMYFLIFGSLKSLNEFTNDFRIGLENWVYGKYINLPEDISLCLVEKKNIEESYPELKSNENG